MNIQGNYTIELNINSAGHALLLTSSQKLVQQVGGFLYVPVDF